MASAPMSRWSLAVFSFLFGSVATIALAGTAGLVIWSRWTPTPAATETRVVFARPQFSEQVMGKTESEVIEAVGRPDETSEDNEARYWHFRGRTKDPVAGTKDTDVQVVIQNGRVIKVNY